MDYSTISTSVLWCSDVFEYEIGTIFISILPRFFQHFPAVSSWHPPLGLGRHGMCQVQQPAQQPQQCQSAGAFAKGAQVPKEGHHQAWNIRIS